MADLDAFTAEGVLDDEVELNELNVFLETLRAPSHPSELAMQRAVVSEMMSRIAVPTPTPRHVRRGTTGRRVTRHVAFGAAAAVLSLGGVAAAATGVNPLAPIIGGSAAPSLEEIPATSQATTSTSAVGSTRPAEVASTSSGPATSGTEKESSSSAPTSIECAEGNHGKTVSSVAKSAVPGKPETKGANHGSVVREAAKSDCGKNSADGETEESEKEPPVTTAGSTPSPTGASASRPAGNGNGKGPAK